jgi:anti-sigma factor ChrR (cupin superfamily)
MNQARSSAIERLHLEQRKRWRRHLPQKSRPALSTSASDTGSSASGSTEVLHPSASLRERLAWRIAAETGVAPVVSGSELWKEPEWNEVAPGISCKLLATDAKRNRISMLVRLGPGVNYPPHRHAGVEELHLLSGELWINDRKLYPGDHNRAEAGTADRRVWSETGCTCALVTSTDDLIQ